MKRLMMLNPSQCGAGDTREGVIYNIIKDSLMVNNFATDENDREYVQDRTPVEYNQENVEKNFPKSQERWITINDDSNEDTFEAYKYDDRFVIFETDEELAHELINRIDGLDLIVINMVMTLRK